MFLSTLSLPLTPSHSLSLLYSFTFRLFDSLTSRLRDIETSIISTFFSRCAKSCKSCKSFPSSPRVRFILEISALRVIWLKTSRQRDFKTSRHRVFETSRQRDFETSRQQKISTFNSQLSTSPHSLSLPLFTPLLPLLLYSFTTYFSTLRLLDS